MNELAVALASHALGEVAEVVKAVLPVVATAVLLYGVGFAVAAGLLVL